LLAILERCSARFSDRTDWTNGTTPLTFTNSLPSVDLSLMFCAVKSIGRRKALIKRCQLRKYLYSSSPGYFTIIVNLSLPKPNMRQIRGTRFQPRSARVWSRQPDWRSKNWIRVPTQTSLGVILPSPGKQSGDVDAIGADSSSLDGAVTVRPVSAGARLGSKPSLRA